MQLAILTAVLAAIAAGEVGGGPVAGVSWRLAVILSAALAAPLAAFAAVHYLSRFTIRDERVSQTAARCESAIIALWLSAVGLMLLVGKWPQIVRANWELAGWPLLDEVAILAPVVAPLLFIWGAMYRLEPDAQNSESPAAVTLLAYLLLQVRHHLALVLLPPLLIVGLIETISALQIAKHLDTVWWFIVPQLVIVLVLMPLAVRRIWQTTPLVQQPLRGILDEICRARRTAVCEMLVWQTKGTMANAAVVGMSRLLRYLLLTDVLLGQLEDEQIAAVVRHELGHLRRWHLPLRLAMLLLPVAWWLAIKCSFPSLESHITAGLHSIGIPSSYTNGAVAPLALLFYAVTAVGWYSRLLEHDADIDACLDEQGRFDRQAANDFCTALIKLCGDAEQGWFSRWLHPAASARITLLNRIAAGPELAFQLRQKANGVALAIVLLYASSAGILMLA